MDVLGRQGRHVLSPPDRIGDEPPVTGRWSGDPVVYDRWFDERWGRWAFAVEAQALLDAAPGLEGARALDAGCGTGRFATVLADAGATVVGIDPDAGMAGLAATRLPGRCGRGAIEQLPFPDGAFDVAVAVTVLEFVDDPAVAMAELARVTRDGGRILVGALNPHSPRVWRTGAGSVPASGVTRGSSAAASSSRWAHLTARRHCARRCTHPDRGQARRRSAHSSS